MKFLFITLTFFTLLMPLTAQQQNKSSECNTKCSISYNKCVSTCKNDNSCINKCSKEVKNCRKECSK
jgi:hypothetical protein